MESIRLHPSTSSVSLCSNTRELGPTTAGIWNKVKQGTGELIALPFSTDYLDQAYSPPVPYPAPSGPRDELM